MTNEEEVKKDKPDVKANNNDPEDQYYGVAQWTPSITPDVTPVNPPEQPDVTVTYTETTPMITTGKVDYAFQPYTPPTPETTDIQTEIQQSEQTTQQIQQQISQQQDIINQEQQNYEQQQAQLEEQLKQAQQMKSESGLYSYGSQVNLTKEELISKIQQQKKSLNQSFGKWKTGAESNVGLMQTGLFQSTSQSAQLKQAQQQMETATVMPWQEWKVTKTPVPMSSPAGQQYSISVGLGTKQGLPLQILESSYEIARQRAITTVPTAFQQAKQEDWVAYDRLQQTGKIPKLTKKEFMKQEWQKAKAESESALRIFAEEQYIAGQGTRPSYIDIPTTQIESAAVTQAQLEEIGEGVAISIGTSIVTAAAGGFAISLLPRAAQTVVSIGLGGTYAAGKGIDIYEVAKGEKGVGEFLLETGIEAAAMPFISLGYKTGTKFRSKVFPPSFDLVSISGEKMSVGDWEILGGEAKIRVTEPLEPFAKEYPVEIGRVGRKQGDFFIGISGTKMPSGEVITEPFGFKRVATSEFTAEPIFDKTSQYSFEIGKVSGATTLDLGYIGKEPTGVLAESWKVPSGSIVIGKTTQSGKVIESQAGIIDLGTITPTISGEKGYTFFSGAGTGTKAITGLDFPLPTTVLETAPPLLDISPITITPTSVRTKAQSIVSAIPEPKTDYDVKLYDGFHSIGIIEPMAKEELGLQPPSAFGVKTQVSLTRVGEKTEPSSITGLNIATSTKTSEITLTSTKTVPITATKLQPITATSTKTGLITDFGFGRSALKSPPIGIDLPKGSLFGFGFERRKPMKKRGYKYTKTLGGITLGKDSKKKKNIKDIWSGFEIRF